MDPLELHARYAPIVHFAQGERFYPMGVDDFLSYAALYSKDREEGLVPRGQIQVGDLLHAYPQETFLRSVDRGPLWGSDVAREWGSETLQVLYQWARSPTYALSTALARRLYDWFSEKTESATRLFWWNKLLAQADPGEGSRRSDLPRFRLPPTVRDSAVENYEQSQGAHPRYTYYYRLAPSGAYIVLQYWFFYAFNDWASAFGGFNDHEGDWEGLQIFFPRQADQRPGEPPAFICYQGHHSRITKPWTHQDIRRSGTHPHAYAAAGSHASYPERKPYTIMSLYNLVDYATGDGFILDHGAWQQRLDLEEIPWIREYRGSWGTRYWLPVAWLQRMLSGLAGALPGEISLPGVSAPRGPRFNDDGSERGTWRDAEGFAGLVEHS